MATNEAGNAPQAQNKPKTKKKHHVRIDSAAWSNLSHHLSSIDDDKTITNRSDRLIVVRYYLDRPGYGLHNSAARLWFNAPSRCTPLDIQTFLEQQRISLPGLLVEVYLDKYESFMLLEACESSCVEWDFQHVTYHDPGILNIRLTDVKAAEQEEENSADKKFPDQQQPAAAASPATSYANPTSAGLFSFSMMVGLETAALFGKLVPGTVDPSFALAHGPYMIFVGGVMQLLVASFNVMRGNLYGSIAFFGFGTFWFSNGMTSILSLHFSPPDSEAGELLDRSDPWGVCIRAIFVFLFSCALLKQTFVMSQLSTTLIGLLCLKVGVQAFTGWSEVMEWLQLVFGTITSVFAFYVFLTELTNGVYQREVFPPFKWSKEHSPEEVFGAAGRSGTLTSNAARLRQALYPDVPRVRGAMDEIEREASQRRLDTSQQSTTARASKITFSQPEHASESLNRKKISSKKTVNDSKLSTTEESLSRRSISTEDQSS